MRKYIVIFLAVLFILSINLVSYAASSEIDVILSKKINIVYNEELKEFYDVNDSKVYPLLYEGTTYLPIRAISALFDIPVLWDGEDNKVMLGKGDVVASTSRTVSLFVGGENQDVKALRNETIKIEYKEKVQKFTDVNGKTVYPLTYNNTTYLPVRAISNMYGANVEWNNENQRITLTRENKIAEITNVTIKILNDTLCAEVTTNNPLYDYKYYSLTEPNRIILDLQNSKMNIPKDPQNINYGVINQVRFGDQGNNVNRLVLDVSEIGTYSVWQSKDRCTTYLALSEDFEIDVETGNAKKDYVLVASIGDKIYVPEIDKIPSGENSEQNSKSEIENPTEELKPSGDNIDAELSGDNYKNESSGDTSELVPSGDNEILSGDNESNTLDQENNETSKENNTVEEKEEIDLSKLAKVTSVVYSSSTDKLKVSIKGNYEYKKFVLDNPTRIVVDIEGAILDVNGPTEINPRNKNIEEIRFSQNEVTKVRIVFELKNVADCKIVRKSSTLELKLEEPEYQNVQYSNNGENATLTLFDVKKSIFETTKNTKYNRYTLSFSSSKFDAGKSTINVEDEFVEDITIKSNKIIIDGSGKTLYKIKQDGKNVVIEMQLSGGSGNSANGDFMVLLDAGHGGSDPGACNGKEYEKKYNLAVMLKLAELLEDEGITVYTSRNDDTYLDKERRVEFATSYEDADLFVSVHHNSLANKNYSGTMVLYYDNEYEKDYGITSKELAEIVQDELVNALDTRDLGVVSRDDLWVLYYSELPSILCEVAFMSNDDELSRIITEEFQDAAAQAIFDGIMTAKKQMGK